MAYIGKREAGNNKRGPNDTSGVILGPRYNGSKNCSNVCSFVNDCIGIEC